MRRVFSLYFLVSASVAPGLGQGVPPTDFYVAPDGNDDWSGRLPLANAGRTDGPFASPARALQAVRQARSAVVERATPLRVVLRGGTYRLAEPLVLAAADSRLTWTAWPGERPVLSGGLPIGGWTRRENGLWAASVPGGTEFHQLFVNGQRRTRARHPNEGYLRTAGNLPEITNVHEQRNEPAAKLGFTYQGDDLQPWPDLAGANIVLYYDWSTSRHWIDRVDPETHTVHFTNPTGWPVCFWEKNQRYHLENVRAALDQPGEWYLDRAAGEVLYRPLPEEDLAAAEVVAPVLERLVELRGDPGAGQWVEQVTFEGIAFEYADWRHDRTAQMEAQAAVFLQAAVLARGARDCVFERCELAHLGEYALWLEAGCQHCRISQCEFRDLGGGGVRIGTEGYTEEPDRTTSHNTVDNCFIHDAGHVFPDGVGIWIGHSSHNAITHNEISDIVYSGISAGWSWGYGRSGCHHNIIEWNHVHHLGFGVLSELSAIYTLGISPGTTIRYNLLHDTYDYAFGSWGLGLDEGTSEVLVENNLIYRHGHGIGLHYGRDNMVRNNIIALCRADLLGVGRVEEHQALEFTGNLCYGNSGVIATGNWRKAKVLSDRNLYWDTALGAEAEFCGLFFDEWQEETQRDLGSLLADPMFVDPAGFDFRLRPGSPAARVGFVPFDLTGVGLYGDPAWVARPTQATHRPFDYPETVAQRRRADFADDFEDTPVGDLPKHAQVSGEIGGASIRVTDEHAASGAHALKFTDVAGLEQSWQPHFFYTPQVPRGEVELSFDVRLESGAILVMVWRDWRAEMLQGPHLRLTAGGALEAADGQKVMDVPVGEWLHVVVTAPVGAKGNRKYRLAVTPRGGQTITVADLPFLNDTFRQLTWIGFISDGTVPAATYLDNVRLVTR